MHEIAFVLRKFGCFCLCIRSGKCPTVKTASLEPTCLCSHVQRVTFLVKRLGQCNAQVEGMASPQDELLHRKLTGVVLLIVGFNLEVHFHKDCATNNLFLGDPRLGPSCHCYTLFPPVCALSRWCCTAISQDCRRWSCH